MGRVPDTLCGGCGGGDELWDCEGCGLEGKGGFELRGARIWVLENFYGFWKASWF